MHNVIKTLLRSACCFFSFACIAEETAASFPSFSDVASTHASLKTLYDSLDPLSVSEHLAFYELYPKSSEGQRALSKAWQLLKAPPKISLSLPLLDISALISLVTRQSFDPPVKLSEEQLTLIENISSSLKNRELKGSKIWKKEELLALSPEEIDLSRGLLLNQFENSADCQNQIRQYEASLDLMALQILARLKENATSLDKVREINRFIFQEMQFRFPPHSLHVKDIDLYTFLPSVLDSRKGVCLGVSILYLSLAQRLDLPLEIITPPGHIYVRYRDVDRVINIETTARGINLPDDTYLGINTRLLHQRNMKEVIGLAFINQASVAWGRGDFQTTVSLYEKAALYLPEDPLLKMFLGLNYLFVDKKKEGKKLLEQIKNIPFEDEVSPESIPEDYLNRKVDAEGIKVVFLPVDETRESIVEKQRTLEKTLKKHPQFRAGLLQLAIAWLQLGRVTEGLEVLERYHKIDPNNAMVEYYLAVLSIERLDYNNAWTFLKKAEEIVHAQGHDPKALKDVRESLKRACPENRSKSF